MDCSNCMFYSFAHSCIIIGQMRLDMVPDTPETVPEMQDTPPCLCPSGALKEALLHLK